LEEAADPRDAGGDFRSERLAGGLGSDFTASVKASQPSLYGVRQPSETLDAAVPVNSHRRLTVSVRAANAVLLRLEARCDETGLFAPRNGVLIRRDHLDKIIRALVDARNVLLGKGGA
jgi:hypothetical protein